MSIESTCNNIDSASENMTEEVAVFDPKLDKVVGTPTSTGMFDSADTANGSGDDSKNALESAVKVNEKIEPETMITAMELNKSVDPPTSNRPKYSSILDSDSEDEIAPKLSYESTTKISFANTVSDDSDSSLVLTVKKKIKKSQKIKRILNSDSENEETNGTGTTSENEGNVISEDHDQTSKDMKSTSSKIELKKRISNLIDSESEDETQYNSRMETNSDENAESFEPALLKKSKSVKRRTGSIRAAKDQAMREIHSETQRLLRESDISLPYHRPKQRTLQEFLNRKKTLPTLPSTVSTAVKVKMSVEFVEKVLVEKEKEASRFYKSSSDSEEETETARSSHTSTTTTKKPDLQPNATNNIEDMGIEETQKLVKNLGNNADEKKKVLKQGDKDVGVPRKLFDTEIDLFPDNESTLDRGTSDLCDSNLDAEALKKPKEFKQGLKTASVPRKLFTADSDDSTKTGNDDGNNAAEHPSTKESPAMVEPNDTKEAVDSVVGGKAASSEPMEEESENVVLEMSDDFSLHMSEEPCPPVAAESTAITETPFISKEEVSKSNKDKQSHGVNPSLVEDDDINLNQGSKNNSSDEACVKHVDRQTADAETPIGHVYGLPLDEFDDIVVKPKLHRLQPDMMKVVPKLVGTPDMMIDLSTTIPKTNAIISLDARIPDRSVTTTRLEETANGFNVVTEVLSFKPPTVSAKSYDSTLSKPGAKLVRLKEELKQQIAAQRTKEWQLKEQEKAKSDENVSGYDSDESEANESKDLIEELEESGESEPEEDDVPMRERKSKKSSLFVDEEAEVSEDEANEDDDEEDEEEEEDDEEKEEDEKEDHEEEEDDENEEKENEEDDVDGTHEEGEDKTVKSYKLKRIVKAFEDDDSDDSATEEKPNPRENSFRRTKTDVDLFETDNNSSDRWLSDAEGDLPAYQPRVEETSQETPLVAKNSLSMVSPITQLTALNTGSGNRGPVSASNESFSPIVAPLSVERTQFERVSPFIKDAEKRPKLLKKLFDDSMEVPNDVELMDLCSGQFSGIASEKPELDQLVEVPADKHVSDAELLDLCSGTFTTQVTDAEKLEKADVEANKSGNEESDEKKSRASDDDDLLEKKSGTGKSARGSARIILSSDSEDGLEDLFAKQKRKSNFNGNQKIVKRLELSDEESSEDENEEEEEQKIIEYDSEENEIEISSKKVMTKVASKFLDEEAELSESEWGSADEDEQNLDQLEMEEGDLDDIDQDQVRNQLEKIHMKQVMDKDQREVKLLQEMLLEDGELHSDGATRQRKFKWKNIDKLEEGGLMPTDIDDGITVDAVDHETELEWCKTRLEREKFLEKHKAENALGNIENEEDSQLLQFGMRALKKLKNKKLPATEVTNEPAIPKTLHPRHNVVDLFPTPTSDRKRFALQNALHRGSFLARDEETLAKLSEMTKQNDAAMSLFGAKKSSRNFTFSHYKPSANQHADDQDEALSQTDANEVDSKSRKRKPESTATPALSKKHRTDTGRNSQKASLFFD